MFRFGITDRNDLAAASYNRRRPPYSYALLGDFGEEPSEAEEVAIEEICEQMAGGHSGLKRRTWRGRYREVDEVIATEIERFFPIGSSIRIHDMAASNAITSLDLFERLRDCGASVHATDHADAVDVVTLPGGRWKVIFDTEGRALQFVGRRVVIDAQRPDRRRFPVNRAMRRALNWAILPRARAVVRTGDRAMTARVSLFHPKCLAVARKDGRFTVGRDNLFDPLPGIYDLVRIMGVFRVLPDSAVVRAVRAVSPHVVSGGLLVIGVNDGQETTIFRKVDGGLQPVRDIGPGFDRRAIVCA